MRPEPSSAGQKRRNVSEKSPSGSGKKEVVRRRAFLASGAGAAAWAAGLFTVGCGDDDASAPAAVDRPLATETPSHPRTGGSLRWLGGPLGSVLDIHRTKSTYESWIWHWAGNFLVRFAAAPPYLPEADLAATLPEVSPDGLSLTFRLRPQAKWQNRAPANGRAVTSEDVKATFDRIKGLGTKSPRAGNYSGVESITAPDAATVVFKLKSPQADILNLLSDQFDIILPREVASRGDEAIKSLDDVVASGPYELTAYEPGRRAQLRRRTDGYWKPDTAWLDGLDLIDTPDDGQKANTLLGGVADFAELPIVLARLFDNDPGFHVVRATQPARECLVINHTAGPFKDPRVRLAMSRAIDRKQVYARVFEGEGRAGGAMSPAAVAWALPEAELAALPGFGPRDSELREAKALLAAAGLGNGLDDTVLTVSALKTNLVNEAVVADLAEIGVRLRTFDLGDDFATLLDRLRKGEFNLATTVFLAGIYPDAQLYLYHHSKNGAANYGKYASAALDAKLERQRTLYDIDQRRSLVREIQRDIVNAPGPLWIGSRIVSGVASARVHNLVATPFVSGYDDAESVWLG